MVRIRLRRLGKNSRPHFRIVVADQRAARDGSFIDLIGTYDPLQNPPAININEEKALKWLRQGARPSDSVAQLFKKQGVLERVKTSA
jgi:small subunit ribosomal protein S16